MAVEMIICLWYDAVDVVVFLSFAFALPWRFWITCSDLFVFPAVHTHAHTHSRMYTLLKSGPARCNSVGGEFHGMESPVEEGGRSG